MGSNTRINSGSVKILLKWMLDQRIDAELWHVWRMIRFSGANRRGVVAFKWGPNGCLTFKICKAVQTSDGYNLAALVQDQ